MDFDNFDEQLKVEHLLLSERACRVCGKVKNLITDYYLTRKNRGEIPSSYSYECKVCTIQRIVKNRKNKAFSDWKYPDW